jgi:hypothetical protein
MAIGASVALWRGQKSEGTKNATHEPLCTKLPALNTYRIQSFSGSR